jgi:hypothetical protein
MKDLEQGLQIILGDSEARTAAARIIQPSSSQIEHLLNRYIHPAEASKIDYLTEEPDYTMSRIREILETDYESMGLQNPGLAALIVDVIKYEALYPFLDRGHGFLVAAERAATKTYFDRESKRTSKNGFALFSVFYDTALGMAYLNRAIGMAYEGLNGTAEAHYLQLSEYLRDNPEMRKLPPHHDYLAARRAVDKATRYAIAFEEDGQKGFKLVQKRYNEMVHTPFPEKHTREFILNGARFARDYYIASYIQADPRASQAA